jgi:hypothetical protein
LLMRHDPDDPSHQSTLTTTTATTANGTNVDTGTGTGTDIDTDTATLPTDETNNRLPSRNKRHGARNQNRSQVFAKWIMDTFPSVVKGSSLKQEPNGNDDGNDTQQQQQQQQPPNTLFHILDVAGGKGEVSARLTMCHLQRVVMVDPRPANVAQCYETLVLPKLPKKWRQQIEIKQASHPTFVQETVQDRFSQLVTTFDYCPPVSRTTTTSSTTSVLHEAIQRSSLLLGLHADNATEAIVDAALHYQKPFVVVPCCVFPNFFQQRFLPTETAAGIIHTVPVRSHEQFCLYLAQKDPRFVVETLPFEGRNVAIWWNGI